MTNYDILTQKYRITHVGSLFFSHHLRSDQAPSDFEARQLKALIANSLEEISVIDAEIEPLKRKLASIQKSIEDCNTILAPIRHLSMNVLGMTSVHCLATHRNPIMKTSIAPILITDICSAWRSIAVSIPQLWSRLHIRLFAWRHTSSQSRTTWPTL